MQSFEPANIHVMTSKELERYGLGATDVIYDERTTADRAGDLGISSLEQRTRSKRSLDAATGISSECKDIEVEPTEAERSQAAELQARGVPITAEQVMEPIAR
jgi:hypothetical protein